MTIGEVKMLNGVCNDLEKTNEVLEVLQHFVKTTDDGLTICNNPGDNVHDTILFFEDYPGLLDAVVEFVTKRKEQLEKILDSY